MTLYEVGLGGGCFYGFIENNTKDLMEMLEQMVVVSYCSLDVHSSGEISIGSSPMAKSSLQLHEPVSDLAPIATSIMLCLVACLALALSIAVMISLSTGISLLVLLIHDLLNWSRLGYMCMVVYYYNVPAA